MGHPMYTGGQVRRILSIIEESCGGDRQQVERAIESGALHDVFGGNYQDFDREMHRHSLGIDSQFFLIDCRRASMPEDWAKENSGWSVAHHRNMGVQVFDPQSLTLFLPEFQKTGTVEGHDLRKLLAEEATLPDAYLDFLLAHPEFIPESWKGKYVYFWGTIYRDPDGCLCVRYLCWLGSVWGWDDGSLEDAWDSNDPAAALNTFPEAVGQPLPAARGRLE